MNCRDFHELAAMAALGILDPAKGTELESYCRDHPWARAEMAWLYDTVATFAVVVTGPETPSQRLKSGLMERIRRTRQVGSPSSFEASSSIPAATGFVFLPASDNGWRPLPIPGVRVKILAHNSPAGYRVVLLELSPGCRFPKHSHALGPEELYLLSGDLVTEGRTMRGGDYLHAERGTEHGELWSPSGCVALVVEPVPTAAAVS